MNKVFIKFFVLLSFVINFHCQALTDITPSNIESYEPYAVGELGKAWQFPSDHLPVGATLGNFHIAFWNILNKNFLFHIEENTQGLKNSSILTDNVHINKNETLTVREMIVGQQILEMITHPTHPRSLIALQETHEDVLTFLKAHLPSSWVILTPPNQLKSQDIFLYNTEIFELIDLSAVKYTREFPKTIFTLMLREKDSKKLFRFIQSHIPGGPINSAESCAKFSKEALKQYNPNLTIVLMGDMNQPPGVIEQALNEAAEELSSPQPYHHLPVKYPSHVNTHLKASWIDNFFVFSPENQDSIRASHVPEELFNALVPIVQLLQSYSK